MGEELQGAAADNEKGTQQLEMKLDTMGCFFNYFLIEK